MQSYLKSSRIAAVLLACGIAAAAQISRAEPFTPIDAAAENKALGRGVNVLGYDPVWKNPSQARFNIGHFQKIHDAGFQSVRIVLQSFDYIDANGKLDPTWLSTLDTMVKGALDQGLVVILDEHDFLPCAADLAACQTKLRAFWSQIAPRYSDASNRLIFEILNEPHGQVTDEIWNGMAADMLALIRTTNPTRNVIIGGGQWNGLAGLPTLKLPENDRHIIATFHYYSPMPFTHQGAPWAAKEIQVLSNIPWGSDADYAALNKDFDTAKAWGEANDRPLFLGEFGAYEKAPLEYRVKWDSAVARAAEARGFSWAYWQFDSDFVVFDMQTQQFVQPILHALIPE